jgi:hypothetical protein
VSRQPTPVVVFAYNRPRHLETTLLSLSECARLDECRVFIRCDGPKEGESREAVEATREVARSWAPKLRAEVHERTTNQGLARSVAGGVGELCETFGQAIVVEDDLCLNRSFLDFMLQGLERYRDEPQVYQISGYTFPVSHRGRADAIWLPLTATWGWATWARAWRAFSWAAEGAKEMLADEAMRHRFDLNGSYPFSEIMRIRLEERNDSWGILWMWAVFKAGGMVLHPRESLVWNAGFDGSGVHCGRESDVPQPECERVLAARLRSPLRLPDPATGAHDGAVVEVQKLFRNQFNPSLLERVRRRVARLWTQSWRPVPVRDLER